MLTKTKAWAKVAVSRTLGTRAVSRDIQKTHEDIMDIVRRGAMDSGGVQFTMDVEEPEFDFLARGHRERRMVLRDFGGELCNASFVVASERFEDCAHPPSFKTYLPFQPNGR